MLCKVGWHDTLGLHSQQLLHRVDRASLMLLQLQQASQQLLLVAKQGEGDVPIARVFCRQRLLTEGHRQRQGGWPSRGGGKGRWPCRIVESAH